MANELGQPQERSVHAAISLESLQKVSLLAGVPVDQLPTEAVPETTFLNYHYRGLSLKFVNEVLMGIYAFTGLPVSNDTTPWGNFFADAPSSSFVDLASMDRVTGLLGRPQRSGSSVLCDIPNAWMDYNGLFFDFQAESGLLARVSVHKK